MNVETYEVIERETGEQAPEMETEAIEIIEALGLTGQQELLKPSEEDVAVQTRIPYRQMTAEEDRIYSQLCPDNARATSYETGPIPLRVLQVLAHATPLFAFVEVWYSGTVLEKDPILVGFLGEQRYNAKKFILARWGDELGSLEELREKAVAKWKAQELKKATAKIADCKVFIAGGADLEAEKFFNGDWVNTPA